MMLLTQVQRKCYPTAQKSHNSVCIQTWLFKRDKKGKQDDNNNNNELKCIITLGEPGVAESK